MKLSMIIGLTILGLAVFYMFMAWRGKRCSCGKAAGHNDSQGSHQTTRGQ